MHVVVLSYKYGSDRFIGLDRIAALVQEEVQLSRFCVEIDGLVVSVAWSSNSFIQRSLQRYQVQSIIWRLR